MAWLNLLAILLLTKLALKVLKDYETQKKEGKDPIFDPQKIRIENIEFWEERRTITKQKIVNESTRTDDNLKF